jgi:hypothetical protein
MRASKKNGKNLGWPWFQEMGNNKVDELLEDIARLTHENTRFVIFGACQNK